MSIIYERTNSYVTNELCYDDCNHMQFQFLGDNCVTVWNDGEIWLMLKSNYVNNDGWVRNRRWIAIYDNGNVVCR